MRSHISGLRRPTIAHDEIWIAGVSPHGPWADCNDEQRLDVHNGLLLSGLWEAAFDAGLISFADCGAALASPDLSVAARTALQLESAPRLPDLREDHRANLAADRAGYGPLDQCTPIH